MLDPHADGKDSTSAKTSPPRDYIPVDIRFSRPSEADTSSTSQSGTDDDFPDVSTSSSLSPPLLKRRRIKRPKSPSVRSKTGSDRRSRRDSGSTSEHARDLHTFWPEALSEETIDSWQERQILTKLTEQTTLKKKFEFFDALSDKGARQKLIERGDITAAPTADELKAKDDAFQRSLKSQQGRDAR